MTLTAWALTTGEAGMRSQAVGLARAIASVVVEKAPPRRWSLLRKSQPPEETLAPPWPDVVVSCGRRSAAGAIAIKRASGGRTLAVHVQDPRSGAAAFDLVVAMDHDRIAAGGKVIKVATALHDVTSESLSSAQAAWKDRLEYLGRPIAGVIIGGDLKGRPFTESDTLHLLKGLRRLRQEGDSALAITPSRRTPQGARDMLSQAFAGDRRVFLWDLEGDNPYQAILAMADRLVVTSDSVSMVSEALSTPHPVEVYDLGFARHVDFIQGLVDRGLIRRFTGDPSFPSTAGPVNATLEAAAAVRALIQARTGVVG